MTLPPIDLEEHYAELKAKYTQQRSPSVLRMVRAALGTDLANGFTTLEQAEELLELLDLGADDALLDLGAGRGWPGVHVAARTGCRLVSSDLTFEAATSARAHLAGSDLGAAASPVVADGTALPFRSGAFKGLVHADVLC